MCSDLGTSMKVYGFLKRAARRLAKKAKGAIKRIKIIKELL